MTMSRRRFVAGAAGIGTGVALAGCLGVLTGDEALRFEAQAAVVPPSVRDSEGYEEHETTKPEVTREFSAAGQTREVTVQNVVAQYDRGVDIPVAGRARAAVFTVLSTPQVKILGKTFNPVKDMSTDEIVDMVQQRYERVQNVRRADSRTVSILGTETEAVRYTADATLAAGASVEVYLTVTEVVADADDFVLCFAAYPRSLDERETVTALANGVRHGD
ncbi:DUF6517 family protein [Halomarina halobia]|uniref:DUF6517 family protein n=1 Tax=Halomarina halobia TaxID=3033386 RepID=A0ABD6A9U3_9EURY|nr:DUF6517 family protein [Halomarina sp. PSR21]